MSPLKNLSFSKDFSRVYKLEILWNIFFVSLPIEFFLCFCLMVSTNQINDFSCFDFRQAIDMAIFIFTHSQDVTPYTCPLKDWTKISATFSSTTLFMTVKQLLPTNDILRKGLNSPQHNLLLVNITGFKFFPYLI